MNDTCPACGKNLLFAKHETAVMVGTWAHYPCPFCGVRLKDNVIGKEDAVLLDTSPKSRNGH